MGWCGEDFCKIGVERFVSLRLSKRDINVLPEDTED